MNNQAVKSSPAMALTTIPEVMLPNIVSTPMGTLNITLMPPPQVAVPLVGNVVFWVAILSFVGVVLSLWQARSRTKQELAASEARMRTELAASASEATIEREQSREQANLDRLHHSEQAHQERITKARREVYLELISEMTKAQMALSLLPMQDIEKIDTHVGFGGLITATSKISILGEMSTVTMSRELLTAIHEGLFRILVLLIPMNEHKASGKYHEEQLFVQREKVDKISAEIQLAEEELIINKQFSLYSSLSNLKISLKFRNKEAARHGDAAIAEKLALSVEHRKYSKAVLTETKIISRKVDELIDSIRIELALGSSLEQLHATSGVMHAAAEAALESMYVSVDQR